MLARVLSWLVLLARSDPAKDVEILVLAQRGWGIDRVRLRRAVHSERRELGAFRPSTCGPGRGTVTADRAERSVSELRKSPSVCPIRNNCVPVRCPDAAGKAGRWFTARRPYGNGVRAGSRRPSVRVHELGSGRGHAECRITVRACWVGVGAGAEPASWRSRQGQSHRRQAGVRRSVLHDSH